MVVDGPGSCRICVKSLSYQEVYRICSACQLKVCDDCASYSTQETGGSQVLTLNNITFKHDLQGYVYRCHRTGIFVTAILVEK